ncbi:XRE family transcriptional regulator [Salinicoccus roseus]|uniref:XRE family transcriptional regulator n=1 Tax=Salinicoccus roseus TaxID=45670 RepID=UPI002301BDBC|nr:XRE family transcriptional regulator [Salinicoccus roseus]
MKNKFNGNRFKEARLYNRLSITELATKLGVTKQMVSKYEHNNGEPSFEKSLKLFEVLNYPREFFYTAENYEFKNQGTFFRSRLTATQKSKVPANYLVKYAVVVRDFLEEYIEFPKLQDRDKYEEEIDIEKVAKLVRKDLNLAQDPIDDIVEVAELLGIMVIQFKYDEEKIDAFSSMCTLNNKDYFVVVTGNKRSFYRQQFSIAHELGHWILHKEYDPQELNKEEYKLMEKEANNFAAALLLPEDEFKSDLEFNGISIDTFLKLKLKWNVSMAAMIERASQLKLLSVDDKGKLYRKMNYRQWRNPEPYDLEKEVTEPLAISQALELLMEERIMTGYEFKNNLMNSYNLYIPQSILAEVCNVEEYIFNDSSKSNLNLKIKNFSSSKY